MGPVASQEAIKLLGTNGGGFFNVNSAHPFENPTGFTNLFEMLAVLVIPAALVFTYGRMAGNRRQGYAIYATMMVMFLGAVIVCLRRRGPRLAGPARRRPAHRRRSPARPAATWRARSSASASPARRCSTSSPRSPRAARSTARSSPSPGSAARCRSPTCRPRRSIFGGVGTGLYSILLYVLLAVFIGGLMVGRTPEYLGKKIEAREIKLVALGLLITPLAALFSTALATASQRRPGVDLRRRHRAAGVLRDVLRLPHPGQQQRLGVRRLHRLHPAQRGQPRRPRRQLRRPARRLHMLFARYAPILFALAVAGSLAGKRVSPPGLGTMRTDNATFVVLLIGVIILVGALTFFPALLLGPIVQGLTGHLY